MNPVRGAHDFDPATEAMEFVRFCYQRRRIGWPELYDEMCAVAARGLYKGWTSTELATVGIGLTLFEMPALAALTVRVVAERGAERQPEPARVRARPSARPAAAGA